MGIRKFHKAFRPPFRYLGGSWVGDSNDQFCFQLVVELPTIRKNLLEIINGRKTYELEMKFSHKDGYIIMSDPDEENEDGEEVILIRGWGYLTGGGGLNLPNQEAAEIQDDLAAYLCEQLNRKE